MKPKIYKSDFFDDDTKTIHKVWIYEERWTIDWFDTWQEAYNYAATRANT